MIALRLEFLAGRFHANPWDRGTNEGDVEWPPSPWRLLRAVVAGWYRCGARDRELLLRVLDALAEPPRFHLPHASAGHTRHYVPLGGFKNGKPETTQIIDSFLALDKEDGQPATAYVEWPNAHLTGEESAMLERCCVPIGYLGRAESWCKISVAAEITHNAALQCVDLASRAEQAGPVVRRLAAGPSLRGVGLLRALTESTAEMRQARRLVPPGAAWLEYRLPPDFLLVSEQHRERNFAQKAFERALFRFAIERPRQGVLPPITDALDLAEIMRRAVLSRYTQTCGGPASLRLAGKRDDESGQKREGHDHPMYLPFDSHADGKIDRLDVWFPQGCTHEEYRAVSAVDGLYNRFVLGEPLPLTFIGQVEPSVAAVWESATPVVLERFPKIRGGSLLNDPSEQLQAMVRRATGVDAAVEVWRQPAHIRRRGAAGARVDTFHRRRRGTLGGQPPAIAATLRFDTLVQGPIVLGRLAHFGLGQFLPSDSAVAAL